MLVSIAQLLSEGRAPEHPVYYTERDTVRWQHFGDRLTRLHSFLAQHPTQRWLLAREDAGEFALWLLALLAAGKHIVIPPNFQPGTLDHMGASCAARAEGIDIDCLPPGTPIATGGLDRACIELHTSGSSGEPKCVSKYLVQLELEVKMLEELWGAKLGRASIVATVPHHHIYGLLFRLLWPLAAGRPFDVVQCAHPDMLQQRLQLVGDNVLVASPALLARLPGLIELDKLTPWPRLVFSSGGPLPLATAKALHAHCSWAPLEIYGSTETGGIAWREQLEDDCWTPMPGIEISTDAMSALLHSPFLSDTGPHRLDDAVELSTDGRFRLLGRVDRVVKIEEKRLSLPDMESRLQSHPLVAQAVGVVLDGTRRSIGMVLTLTDEGKAALASRGRHGMASLLRDHLAVHFDAVLLPRYWRYLDSLPYTAQGKLPVTVLQELFSK